MKTTLFSLIIILCLSSTSTFAQSTCKNWVGAGFNINANNILPDGFTNVPADKTNYINYSINLTLARYIKANTLIGIMPFFSRSVNARHFDNKNVNNNYINDNNNRDYTIGIGAFLRRQYPVYSDKLFVILQPSISYSYKKSTSSYFNTSSQFNMADSTTTTTTNDQNGSGASNITAISLASGMSYFINSRIVVTALIPVVSGNFHSDQIEEEYRKNGVVTSPNGKNSQSSHGFSGAILPFTNLNVYNITFSLSYLF